MVLMGVDKLKAINGMWRIKEATLLGVALIGGSLGGLLEMLLFHHKTRHPAFSVGIPVFLVIHLLILKFVVGLF